MARKMRRKSKRYSRQKRNCRKTMRGGNGLFPLNPSPFNITQKQSLKDLTRIPLKNPSPTLERSIPFSPPRPSAPSPPPPLGMSSGPAFGLRIPAPPMLVGGGNKHGCGCYKGGKRTRRKSYKKKYKR